MFKDSDFEWLSIIECLKKTGMPIKEIKHFIDWCIEGDSTIDQRLDLINRQREAVLQQLKQVQDTLDMLDYKCWHYETAKAAGTCNVHKTMPETDIPEKYHVVIKRAKGLDIENFYKSVELLSTSNAIFRKIAYFRGFFVAVKLPKMKKLCVNDSSTT